MSKLNKLMIVFIMIFTFANVNTITAQQTVEDQYWEAVKNSTNVEDFKSYLKEYPNGKYAALARQRISPKPTKPGGINPNTGNIGRLPPSNNSSHANSILQTNLTRPNQTNKEFLETWDAEIKKKLPIFVDTIKIYSVYHRCPTCVRKLSSKRLSLWTISTDTSFSQMKAKADALKPALQRDYCASGAPQRRINFHFRTYLKSDTEQKYEYDIFPENCVGKIRENDVQAMQSWANLMRQDFPKTVGDFVFTKAVTRCRAGCDTQLNNSANTLILSINAPNHTRAQVTKEQVEQILKPIILQSYCKTEPMHRGFDIYARVSDREARGITSIRIKSIDCSNQ